MASKADQQFESTMQKCVADMRECQTLRDKLIQELDIKKEDIKSIEEWVKILWL